MIYIKVEFKDSSKEIIGFESKEDLGIYMAENIDRIYQTKVEDMTEKIRITTIEGKNIIRPCLDGMGVLENMARIVDEIELEEDRISQITVIRPRVGKMK